jgi:peroxiredoxin
MHKPAVKRMKIEIYNNQEEAENAQLAFYAGLSPQECWLKAHELSELIDKSKQENSIVFSISLNE